MITKRQVAPRVDETRTYHDRATINGRHLVRGTEITVDGIRGRCAFLRYVEHVNGNVWIDVIHGRTGRSRTVRPDAVRVVHTSRRLGVTAA